MFSSHIQLVTEPGCSKLRISKHLTVLAKDPSDVWRNTLGGGSSTYNYSLISEDNDWVLNCNQMDYQKQVTDSMKIVSTEENSSEPKKKIP